MGTSKSTATMKRSRRNARAALCFCILGVNVTVDCNWLQCNAFADKGIALFSLVSDPYKDITVGKQVATRLGLDLLIATCPGNGQAGLD